MDTWLLFDVSGLAHRAFYTTGFLQHKGDPTGVLFGVFTEINKVIGRFSTDNCAFFFDSTKPGKRETEYLWYKLKRRTKPTDPQIANAKHELRGQIKRMRDSLLPELGYPVFYQDGYEADDLIASACMNLGVEQKAIIVSDDQDLYQCLSKKVSIWHPQKKNYINQPFFQTEYGIWPNQWAEVKTIAGCSTDEIPGARGVGEKKAIQYLRNEMSKTCKAYTTIQEFLVSKQFKINERLVRLPFEGTQEIELGPHKNVTEKKWRDMMASLGFQAQRVAKKVSTLSLF